jgi:hypothetical protein
LKPNEADAFTRKMSRSTRRRPDSIPLAGMNPIALDSLARNAFRILALTTDASQAQIDRTIPCF